MREPLSNLFRVSELTAMTRFWFRGHHYLRLKTDKKGRVFCARLSGGSAAGELKQISPDEVVHAYGVLMLPDLIKGSPAAALGSMGGNKTAERGPDYYRKIAAMRKTRAGGRPRKKEGTDRGSGRASSATPEAAAGGTPGGDRVGGCCGPPTRQGTAG